MVVIENRYKLLAVAEEFNMPVIYDVLAKLKPLSEGLAATDGKVIYVNPEEFNKKGAYDQFFILCHEMLHIVYQHHRMNENGEYLDHGLLNICQDVCINEYLANKLKFREPSGVYLKNLAQVLHSYGYIKYPNLKYRGTLTTPSLYNYISKLCPSEDVLTIIRSMSDGLLSSSGGSQSNTISKNVIKGIRNSLDVGDWLVSEEGGDKPDEDDTDTETSTKSTTDALVDPDTSTTTTAGKGMSDGVTYNVKSTTNVIKKKDILDWVKQFMGNYVVVTGRSRTFSRPNRRIQSSDYVLKGYKYKKNIKDISIYLDISGSMNTMFVSDMTDTLREIYTNTKFKFYLFDTNIYEFDFKQDSNPSCMGGTDIRKVLKHIKDNHQDVTIMITDCYDTFTLDDVKSDLMIFTNNRDFTTRNPKVKLAYWE